MKTAQKPEAPLTAGRDQHSRKICHPPPPAFSRLPSSVPSPFLPGGGLQKSVMGASYPAPVAQSHSLGVLWDPQGPCGSAGTGFSPPTLKSLPEAPLSPQHPPRPHSLLGSSRMIRAALARLQVPSPTTIVPACRSPGSRGAQLRPWTWESERSSALFCRSAALARLLDLFEPLFLCL